MRDDVRSGSWIRQCKRDSTLWCSCFTDDWSETQKTSKYHLAIRLARGAPVLYVNSIGLRSVRATRNDVNRMWSKLQQWLRGPRRVRDNLHVFTPIVIPFRQLPGVEYFNRFLLRINLRWRVEGTVAEASS